MLQNKSTEKNITRDDLFENDPFASDSDEFNENGDEVDEDIDHDELLKFFEPSNSENSPPEPAYTPNIVVPQQFDQTEP